jgi:hypothetical protein
MTRRYHVDIAVFAANTDRKWMDNLLSHHAVPGVESAKQGVARFISTAAIYQIVLTRDLSVNAGIPVDVAVDVARRLLAAPANRISIVPHLCLDLDRDAFMGRVDDLIADAVDSVVPKRRGRPPRVGAALDRSRP